MKYKVQEVLKVKVMDTYNNNNMNRNNMGNGNMNDNINNGNRNYNAADYGASNGNGKGTNNVRFILHKCPNCSAPLQVRYGETSVKCEYCGYTSLISPSEMEQMESRNIAKSSSRKSNIVLSIVLIPILLVFFVFMCFALDTGYRNAGIVALLQCICVITGLLLGLRKKTSGIKVAMLSILILVSFALVIPFFQAMWKVDEKKERRVRTEKETEDYVRVDTTWPEAGIGAVVPRPELEEADIWDNTDEKLSLKAVSISEDFFEEYKEACIKNGFTECVKEHEAYYDAYTKDGYHITTFLSDEYEFRITAEAPIKMEHYLWPESGVGALLPEPDHEYGEMIEDRNRSFRAEIYQVSEEDFETYIQACKAAGFTEDVNQRSDGFDAVDKDGNWVSLFLYSDFYHTLSISAGVPKDEE